MKRIVLLVSILLIGTLIYLTLHRLRVRAYENEAVNTRPFVMERVDFKIQNGKDVPLVTTEIGQRRDGATAKIAEMSPGGKIMRRVDLPGGYIAMIVDALHIKSSGVLPNKMEAARNQRLTKPYPNCLSPIGEVLDGEDELFGQKAVRIIQESPNGLERAIHWRLPDFACTTVQTLRQKRPDLTYSWQTIGGTRLTAFVEQDPDAGMFSATGTYQEMKPSDLKRAVMKNSGITPEKCPKCFVDDPEAEANYQKWQSPGYTP